MASLAIGAASKSFWQHGAKEGQQGSRKPRLLERVDHRMYHQIYKSISTILCPTKTYPTMVYYELLDGKRINCAHEGGLV